MRITTVSEFCLIFVLHFGPSLIIRYICFLDSIYRYFTFSISGIPITSLSPAGPVCYDRQVQLTCHHHDITDTTSSGPIFNQTSPVVWMKDGERIDLPDTYHMVVSKSNAETVVSVTTRKSVFLNGEANYSCAVVYADGSMEESKPVTVRVRGE